MKRKIGWILATLCATLCVALIIAAIAQPDRTLYRRQLGANGYDFLVTRHGSLFIARQAFTPPGGTTGDASEFGQYTFNSNNLSTPITIGAQQLTVQGSRFNITFDPITANIKHGFIWADVLGLTAAQPAGKTMQLTLRVAGAPMWAIALPLCLPLGVMLYRNRTSIRRKRAGLCIHCGYDLRASSDRCPECGAPMVVTS